MTNRAYHKLRPDPCHATQCLLPVYNALANPSLLRRRPKLLARPADKGFRPAWNALQAHGDSIDVSAPVTEEVDWVRFRPGAGCEMR